MSTASQMTIAELNDRFRKSNFGFGRVCLTPVVQMMPIEERTALLEVVRNFNDFNEGNDPWGEHDFGAIEFLSENYFWKFDYYDTSYQYGSDNPADTAITRRVLTVMHSSEY
jgi:hypothetical protein